MLTKRDFLTAIISVVALMSFMMLLSWSKAHAHEDGGMKYPYECCSDMDCAPVEKTEIIQVPMSFAGIAAVPQNALPTQMWVTTKHGTALVPDALKRHKSEDGRAHACIRQVGMIKRVICYFEPPGM